MQETAINIGISCRLIPENAVLLIISADSIGQCAEAITRHTDTALISHASHSHHPRRHRSGPANQTPPDVGIAISRMSTEDQGSDDHVVPAPQQADPLSPSPHVLVISGDTLQYALSPELNDSFLTLAGKCVSVICCRFEIVCVYVCKE